MFLIKKWKLTFEQFDSAGMTAILRILPKNNPNYYKIMAGYQKMLITLLHYNAP
jgi:hypothetical protein